MEEDGENYRISIHFTAYDKTQTLSLIHISGAERIWYIADAFRAGLSVDGVFNLTNIDRWFLVQIEEPVSYTHLDVYKRQSHSAGRP